MSERCRGVEWHKKIYFCAFLPPVNPHRPSLGLDTPLCGYSTTVFWAFFADRHAENGEK